MYQLSFWSWNVTTKFSYQLFPIIKCTNCHSDPDISQIFENVTPSSVKSKLLRVISETPVHVNKIMKERYFNKLKCTNVMMQKRNEAREMVGRNCALGCRCPPPTCALLTRGKPWAPQLKPCYSNPATATNSQTSSLNQFIPIASSTDKTQGIHILISPSTWGQYNTQHHALSWQGVTKCTDFLRKIHTYTQNIKSF